MISKSSWRERLTAATLALMAAFETLRLLTGATGWSLAGALCLILFLGVGNDRFQLRERYLIAVASVVAVCALIFLADPWPLLAEAARRAAYLAAFFLLLTLLRDGAMTSSSVLAVGQYLTQQPPGRRYWALAMGGHAMGVVMNFGALILLAPLVQRGAKDETGRVPPSVVAIREQRQLAALARGFSWFIAWAPTSIAQVVAVAVVTGASGLRVAFYGAIAAALAIIAGWIDDWFTGRAARRRHGRFNAPQSVWAFPATGFRRLGIVYAALVVLSGLAAWWLEQPLVNGIMLSAAPVTVLWIGLQRRAGRGDDRRFGARMRDLLMKTLPDCSPEAATLALAGFIGTVLAGIVPPETIMGMFDAVGNAPSLIYIGLTGFIVLASSAAMPPMLTVTFLGTAASRAGGLGLDPDLLALSLVLGWAINLTGSPFGATNLILGRHTGVPVTTLAWRWNGRFSLSVFGICAILLTVLAH